MQCFFQRTLSKKVLEASASFKLINGPRQVGKTTLSKSLMEENRTFISLDDVMACSLAQNDPALFFQNYKLPILIKDFHNQKNLNLLIKLLFFRVLI